MPAEPVPKPLADLGPPRKRDLALRALAAFGYASRGTVYLLVGVVALLSVWKPREPEGPHQIIGHLIRAPFGKAVLSILGIGLTAYAAWRFLQGALDKDRRGRRPFAVAVRLGFLAGSATYASLAGYAWALVAGAYRGQDGQLVDWTKGLMGHRAGLVLVGFSGGVILCMGIAQALIAWTEGYRRRMTSAWPDSLLLRGIARFGLASKAVSFWIFGSLMIVSSVREERAHPRGLGGALSAVHDAQHGHALLTALAAGLLAYAIYCFLLARYRDARW
jgi:hypothetical protein